MPATSRASAAPTGWCARSRTPACRSPCRRCSPRASTGSTPSAKQLLQVASVVGKEISAEALGLTAGLEDEEIDARAARADRAPASSTKPSSTRERVLAFRHPLTREVAYGTQLAERRADDPRGGGAGDDRARARSPRRARGADRQPHGGRAARRAKRRAGRPAPPTGPGHSRPARRAAPVARRDRARRRARGGRGDDGAGAAPRACSSSTSPGDWGWTRPRPSALAAEAKEIADRTGDLRSLALLKLMTSARPGVAHRGSEWIAAVEEAIALADEAGDLDLRIAIRGAGAYAQMCAGDLDAVDAVLDEMLELTGDDLDAGAGIVISCPLAWALMAHRHRAARSATGSRRPKRWLDRALHDRRRASATRRPKAGRAATRRRCWPSAATSRRRWRWRSATAS